MAYKHKRSKRAKQAKATYSLKDKIETLIHDHLNETFEITEMESLPVITIHTKNGETDVEFVKGHKQIFDMKYPDIKQTPFFKRWWEAFGKHGDLRATGYFYKGTLWVWGVEMKGETSMVHKAMFFDVVQSLPLKNHIKRIPTAPLAMGFDGAKDALKNNTPEWKVSREIVRELRNMASGISFITKRVRKGLVFKSYQSDFSFKVYSPEYSK